MKTKRSFLCTLGMVLMYVHHCFSFPISHSYTQNIPQYNATAKPFKKEVGKLKSVEDAGYPMYVVTLELPQGEVSYLMNMEAIQPRVDYAALQSWIGKNVEVDYTTKKENALLNITLGGKSLLGEVGDLPPNLKSITGVLKGAENETAGDLPDEISITDKSNVTKKFEFFITSSMVKANGKTVVGYYEVRENSEINSIKLAGNTPMNKTATGVLQTVEDIGYPMAFVKIDFPDMKTTEEYILNMSEIPNLDINVLNKWKGKYVKFDYYATTVNALLDVRQNGKSIFPEGNQALGSDVKKIAGVLSGAAEESQGDLPGTVFITDKQHKELAFDYYVTPELVRVNGKNVVGYYEERMQYIITKIKPTK